MKFFKLWQQRIAHRFTQWLLQPVRAATIFIDFERLSHDLKPGDVLLFEGRSRVSEVIRVLTQSPWAHAALYIGRLHDLQHLDHRVRITRHREITAQQQLLIESDLGKGTTITPLSDYQYEHVRICRPQGLSPRDIQLVIGYAIQQLGATYNTRQILDLARFLLPWNILPRRWRSSLFQKSNLQTARTICSTLIAEAFQSVDFPILPGFKIDSRNQRLQMIRNNPMLITPKDFDYSPYFQIIKHPALDLEATPVYKTFPWADVPEHWFNTSDIPAWAFQSEEPIRPMAQNQPHDSQMTIIDALEQQASCKNQTQ